MNSVFITCKCGKQNIWITDATFTKNPCPECGRRYIGKYNSKTLTIEPIEIKKQKYRHFGKYLSKVIKTIFTNEQKNKNGSEKTNIKSR
jgi:hypothetical protein